MMGKIRISPHKRRSYRRRDGTYVSRADVSGHLREDVGAKGRTPKRKRWFKAEGRLDGWGIDKSDTERHNILNRVVRKDGYATTIRRLNALRNVSTSRETDRKAKADMDYLRKEYR